MLYATVADMIQGLKSTFPRCPQNIYMQTKTKGFYEAEYVLEVVSRWANQLIPYILWNCEIYVLTCLNHTTKGLYPESDKSGSNS
jgi:hypothetical protein